MVEFCSSGDYLGEKFFLQKAQLVNEARNYRWIWSGVTGQHKSNRVHVSLTAYAEGTGRQASPDPHRQPFTNDNSGLGRLTFQFFHKFSTSS